MPPLRGSIRSFPARSQGAGFRPVGAEQELNQLLSAAS